MCCNGLRPRQTASPPTQLPAQTLPRDSVANCAEFVPIFCWKAMLLTELPDNVLELIFAHGDAALMLPLVCSSLARVCASDGVRALRLGSRLRMVADATAASAREHDEIGEWEAGHVWAALSQLHDFLGNAGMKRRQVRVSLLLRVPSAERSLAAVLARSSTPMLLNEPLRAEQLFFEAEARRQKASALPWLEAATTRLALECTGERYATTQ